MMLRKLTVVLVAVGTAIAFSPMANATVDAQTAASAATARIAPEVAVVEPMITSCDAGNLCFWVHRDYSGPRGVLAGNNVRWSVFGQGECQEGNWNDCASSAKNRGTQCTAHLHEHTFYGGRRHSIGRGDNRPALSNQSFNDITSSNSWC